MKNKFLNTTIQSKRRSLLRTMAISSVLVIGLNFLLLIPALNDIEQRIFAHQLEVAEKISLEFQQLFADGTEQDIRDFSIELKEEENELVYVADDIGRIVSHYSPSKIGSMLSNNIQPFRLADSSKYAYKFFSHKDVGAQKFQAVSLLIEPINFTVVVARQSRPKAISSFTFPGETIPTAVCIAPASNVCLQRKSCGSGLTACNEE